MTAPKGIGISRQEMIEVLTKPEIGFSFSEGTAIEEQSKFVGELDEKIVQLIGHEYELSEASITVDINWDSKNDEIALNMVNVIGFANLINKSSTDWILKEFQKLSETPQNEYSSNKVL